MSVQWVDDLPKPKGRKPHVSNRWDKILAELRANPGHWGIAATDQNSGQVARLRKVGGGDIEVRGRNYRTDEYGRIRCDVYARAKMKEGS